MPLDNQGNPILDANGVPVPDQVPVAGAGDDAAARELANPLRTEEFTKFLNLERAQKELDRKETERQHQERLEREDKLIKWQYEQSERQVAMDQAANVPKCDGKQPDAVREWIKHIDLTRPYSNLTILIAAQTAQGSLKEEMELFKDRLPDAPPVEWPALKEHLQKSFLSPEEDDRLKLEVERLRQAAYETTSAYGRRFRQAADLAYPAFGKGARPNTQETLLVGHYVRGLSDQRLKEKIIRHGMPEKLSEAMDKVATYEAGNTRILLAKERGLIDNAPIRHEEPMEVGAVGQPRSQKPENLQMKEFCNMQRQVEGLTTNFTKMSSLLDGISKDLKAMKSAPAQTTPAFQPAYNQPGAYSTQPGSYPDYKWAASGLPICIQCKQEGHVARFCQMRNQQRPQQPPRHQQNQMSRRNQKNM